MITGRYAIETSEERPWAERRLDPPRLPDAQRRGSAGAVLLGGCDDGCRARRRSASCSTRAEALTQRVQRLLALQPGAGARIQRGRPLDATSRPTARLDPTTPTTRSLAQAGFADWKLKVGGLVDTPAELTLAELRALPSRTQITRHDCVEGWSASASGRARARAAACRASGSSRDARYLVFHCADDARSATTRTILREHRPRSTPSTRRRSSPTSMNDAPLPMPHGAPLRLRVERQLGYKHAEIRDADRGGGELRHNPRRQRRLLGRPRLRVVRGDLS